MVLNKYGMEIGELMLPKVSVLMLGIISDKPINPHEISILLDILKVKRWFPLASSSVYSTIRKLKKDGLITGDMTAKENMSEKTVYSITEKGREILKDSIREYLVGIELDRVKDNIACLFLCHLHKDEAYVILKQKYEKLKEGTSLLKKQINGYTRSGKLHPLAIMAQDYNRRLIENEIILVEQLLSYIESGQGWVHSPVMYLNKDIE